MDTVEFGGRRLYTGLRLDYIELAVGSYTYASRAISTVGELLVVIVVTSAQDRIYAIGCVPVFVCLSVCLSVCM